MMQTELHQVLPSLQNVSLMKGNRKRNAFTGNPAIKLKKTRKVFLSVHLSCPREQSGSQQGDEFMVHWSFFLWQ